MVIPSPAGHPLNLDAWRGSLWRKAAVAVACVTLCGGALTGCSAISDAVVGQAGNAACVVASDAVDQIAADVTSAIGTLAVDPVAALSALEAAEVAFGVASIGITGEPAAAAVKDIKATLGELITLAEDAVNRAEVDQTALTSLQEQFTADLKALAGVC